MRLELLKKMNNREKENMIDVREYGCVDEVAEKVGMSKQEVVDALSEGKTGLVYNQDYRWAEDERPCRYILLMHIETCANALKKYFSLKKHDDATE